MFEMGLMGGEHYDSGQWNEQLLKMVDTEAKQLQCIEDLYAVMKSQPKYKKMGEANHWKPDTSPIEVLTWLLRRLGKLAEGRDWTVDTYTEQGKTRYRFIVYKVYPFVKHNMSMHRLLETFLPLDFLPRLKKKDGPLHDMIIDVVALVSKANKLPLWDEDGDFSEMVADLLEKGGTLKAKENGIVAQQLQSYREGDARNTLRILRRRRKMVTLTMINRQLGKYMATSIRRRIVCNWIERGMLLAGTRKNIKPYCYTPQFIKGKTLSAERQFKIVWSLDPDDVVSNRAQNKLHLDTKQGEFYPMAYSVGMPGKVMKPLQLDEFPVKLSAWLDDGVRHFLGDYRDYYYGRPVRVKVDNGMRLLDAIERAELRNEVRNS
jgi:hypothetical protein